jgi:hypothetical protein
MSDLDFHAANARQAAAVSYNADAELIAQRMAQLRRDVSHDVERVALDARRQFEWRRVVRRHPWICLAAASAVGYLAVPRLKRSWTTDSRTLAEWAKDGQLKVTVQPPERRSTSLTASVGENVLRFLVPALLRTGTAYLAGFMNAASPGDNGHPPVKSELKTGP